MKTQCMQTRVGLDSCRILTLHLLVIIILWSPEKKEQTKIMLQY
jgi:hypothetical protein